MFIATVSLLAVPLQVALIPMLQMFNDGAHLTLPLLDKTITIVPDLDLAGTTTAVWLTHTGFAMPFAIFLLHNYISTLPKDLFEAARIDGANEWQTFRNITVPIISSTIVVVWTTVAITTWKVFDIVFVMTGGRNGTQVIAQQMVQEFFTFFRDGIGAALAVILFIAVIPILVVNVRRFQAQEEMR